MNRWQVHKVKDKFYLRRKVGTTFEYFRGEYNTSSLDEAKRIKTRLNAAPEYREKEFKFIYDKEHAYFSKPIVDKFEAYLKMNSSVDSHVKTQLKYLNHGFEFYIRQNRIFNPTEWPKYDVEFGKFILKLNLGSSSMTRLIQVINKYIRFLNTHFPREVMQVKVNPIPKKKLKDLEIQSRIALQNGDRFINEETFISLRTSAPQDLKPILDLAFGLGLRRGEILGLTKESFFKGYVLVDKQIESFNEGKAAYGPLKDKRPRKVPYWFITPTEAIRAFKEMKLSHADTLSSRVKDFMEKQGYKFTLHDFRRTFITRAIQQYPHTEVMLAVGHEDLRTTSKYLQDARTLDDERLLF